MVSFGTAEFKACLIFYNIYYHQNSQVPHCIPISVLSNVIQLILNLDYIETMDPWIELWEI
jgi:hypothetical protein